MIDQINSTNARHIVTLEAGEVSVETALEVATSPHDFKLMRDAQGMRASDIEQVVGA